MDVERLSESRANPVLQNSLLSRVFGQGENEAPTRRAALYARVSSHDQQTLPLQIKAMREELLAAARRRELDAILVWRLDRWGRSLPDLVVTLKELAELSIGFVSLTEAFDMTTPTGRALAGMLAVFAEYAERAVMRSRELDPVQNTARFLTVSNVMSVWRAAHTRQQPTPPQRDQKAARRRRNQRNAGKTPTPQSPGPLFYAIVALLAFLLGLMILERV